MATSGEMKTGLDGSAALAARRGSEFVVVARVEALIADCGVEEARVRPANIEGVAHFGTGEQRYR